MLTVLCRPLVEVLAEVPDRRQRRGRRYRLEAVLALACAAMLCGARTYAAMAEWGCNYGQDLARALGFAHGRTPCAATFYCIFRDLDCAALEQQLSDWTEGILLALPLRDGACGEASVQISPALEAIAIDGKTLRGSARQGATGVHLLSAFSHRLGLTLQQHPVDDKSNEIKAVQWVLQGLVLEGRVVTVDALLTQRTVAQAIVQKGGTT
jgi:hypothetical protein